MDLTPHSAMTLIRGHLKEDGPCEVGTKIRGALGDDMAMEPTGVNANRAAPIAGGRMSLDEADWSRGKALADTSTRPDPTGGSDVC
jgi:hypothetical protein